MSTIREKKEARIQWLIRNSQKWEGFPQTHFELYQSQGFKGRYKNLILEMKREGLYSPRTIWYDVRLLSLITEARRRIREAT